MFNSMKNQFKEKTGKELPKFTPQKGGLSRQSRQGSENSVCSLVLDQQQQPSPSITQDIHQIKLPDGKVLSNKEVNLLAKKEDEWRQRLEKKDGEWAKKLEKREAEIQNELSAKEDVWRQTEKSLTEDLLKQTTELKDALKCSEELKRKLAQYQEERDTLESFQTQEISKIKHLLLAKEKECLDVSTNLKEMSAMVESLKSEVSRLRPFEERVSNVQVERLSRQAGEEGAERRLAEVKVVELEAKLEEEVQERERLNGRVTKLSEECSSLSKELKTANTLVNSKDGDISDLSKRIHDLEATCEMLRNKKKELQLRCDDEMEKAKNLLDELDRINNDLLPTVEEDKLRLQNELRVEKEKWKATDDELGRERSAKDAALLRNAQISQEVNMAQQNLRQQQSDVDELMKKVAGLENELRVKGEEAAKTAENTSSEIEELQKKIDLQQKELDAKRAGDDVEKGLRAKIADLEEQSAEKNKTIRVLQQKLLDMKKTLQRELKTADNGASEVIMNTTNHVNHVSIVKSSVSPDVEVNHLYMKNVIMKFLTSREYEVALQLTKAVATLLKLNREEESLLKDTVTWRMSWFKTKPRPEDYLHS